jgi:regulator of cell morphogenesis and NO signaling
MKISSSQSTGQIAVEMKEAIPVFEKYGINYYTQGDQSLKIACVAANAPLERVESELAKAEFVPVQWYSQERDWRQEPMAILIYYIVHTHHVKTRWELDNIENFFVNRSKTEVEPSEFNLIRTLFLKLAAELREHLKEEEEKVFPYLIRAERALKPGGLGPKAFPNADGFSNPIRNILFEHGMMDREFKEIEKILFHFNAAGGDCFGSLTQSINELAKDNQKHIHLENNILLKKASQLGLLD